MDRRWHFLLFLFGLLIPSAMAVMGFSALRGINSLSFPSAQFPLSKSRIASPFPAMQRSTIRTQSALPSFSAWDETRLLDLARTGEACALLESPLAARAPLPSLYRLFPNGDGSLISAEVVEAYLQALSSRNDYEFELALRSASHPLLDLTEAESLLGLLPGHSARDPQRAIAGLRALVDADPLNAAPSLLLAYALNKSGESQEASGELERAYSRPVFKTYTQDVIRSLYLRARGRPTLLSAAVAIGSKLEGPDFFSLEDFLLSQLVDADSHLADLAYSFGRRLSAQEGDDPLNFGIGQRIAFVAWKKLHPTQKTPRLLTERPSPVTQRFGLLSGLQLPVPKGKCERELPRLAERLETERAAANRSPAL
jgi:hypothetical protein